MTEMLENGQNSVNEKDGLKVNNQTPITPVSEEGDVTSQPKEEKNTDNALRQDNSAENLAGQGVDDSFRKSSEELHLEEKSEEKKNDASISEKSPEVTEDENVKNVDYDLTLAEEDTDDKAEDDEDLDQETDEPINAQALTIDEIVAHLQTLLDAEYPERKDINDIKNQFYYAVRSETEQQKKAFLQNGGDEIDFVMTEPEVFTKGKELLQKLKEKRLAILSKEEEQKEKNLARKLAIIERVKELTESTDDFNKVYQEFRALQQEWNDIKLVPQAKVNELWKSYQYYVEIFYDLVRINNEFRDYDFKKNLDLKTALCEAAEKLLDESDTISAFHQLQRFHQEWRDIGPVARKDREPIWLRFKEASTEINKRYQSHFEQIRAEENENLEKKQALCEEIEAIDYSAIQSFRDWDQTSKRVIELQTKWREIGYVPRKWHSKIYERYRAACDLFFKNKNQFYKLRRAEMEENMQKKIALCERAEALKDSQDWKNTTQEMISLQKEWKKIGFVPRKHSDSIWKRFIAACDYFFEQKKLNTSSRYAEEQKNLEQKREIIDKIKNIGHNLSEDVALTTLKELISEFNNIGFVPYKQKDKIYKEFHDEVDAQFDRLNIDKSRRQLESFKTNLNEISKSSDKAKNQFLYEREKLMRQYERMKNELQTYENNIGFLSVSSRKGNTLIDDMNKKIKKLKENMDLIVKKIEVIDRQL